VPIQQIQRLRYPFMQLALIVDHCDEVLGAHTLEKHTRDLGNQPRALLLLDKCVKTCAKDVADLVRSFVSQHCHQLLLGQLRDVSLMASLLQRSISSAAVQLDLATFLGVKCCAALVASQHRALSPQRSVPAAARRSLLAPFTSAQRGLPLAGCDALDSIIPPTRLEVLFLIALPRLFVHTLSLLTTQLRAVPLMVSPRRSDLDAAV
jgi:hypothetical protein